MPDFASPASMSIHEEATRAAVTPLMGVFNDLVLFDQHVPQNSLASVVPDLAMVVGRSKHRAKEITTNGDDEVTFHLKRPQPHLLALLTSGVSPIHPSM
jgi:peptide/nickel transport system substrate-binding protein